MQIPGEFLLSSLQAAVDDDLQRPLGAAPTRHAWDIHAQAPKHLHGDRERLQRVIVNLVQDAFDETPGGHITVKVGRHPVRPDRSPARIGPCSPVHPLSPEGTEPVRLELIVMAHSPQTILTSFCSPAHAESLRSIAQMQGQVGRQLTTGSLREFCFAVPLYMPSGRLVSASGHILRRQEILLVDDDRLGRVLMADLLRRQGYSVTEASSGSEALEKYRAQTFHAVVTDLKMPGLDGRQLAEHIRASHSERAAMLPTPHLIVVSASPGAELANIARLQLFDHCLQKPVDFRRLIAALESQ